MPGTIYHTEYWRYSYPQEGEDLICDGTQWSLDVRYENGFWMTYHGDNSFPRKAGLDYSLCSEFIMMITVMMKNKRRKPDEVIYCMVSFNKGGINYSYLTDDESISVGNRVVCTGW